MDKPGRTYPVDVENTEIELLLEGVWRTYGYDFRDYARESLRRRIWKSVDREELHSISGFLERVLHDEACMKRFLNTISIDVSAMFRDPAFFLSFRQNIVPMLKMHPHIKIWHAGCASGEEVYSMAILLHEEGLLGRTRIYATDMNETVLEKAKSRIYSLPAMKEYTANYLKSGGKASFSDYYTARYDNAIFKSFLIANVVWSVHNLVTDASFNEFDCIMCRNVLIYFNQKLKDRVINLFSESLPSSGVLALGKSEALNHKETNRFIKFDENQKIYIKSEN